GPPEPVPVGSPPWITKFRAIRWNRVPSKNPFLARKTRLFTVFGAVLGSSSITIFPHEVWSVARYVVPVSIDIFGGLENCGLGVVASFGALAPQATAFGPGEGSTVAGVELVADGAGVPDAVAPDPPPLVNANTARPMPPRAIAIETPITVAR